MPMEENAITILEYLNTVKDNCALPDIALHVRMRLSETVPALEHLEELGLVTDAPSGATPRCFSITDKGRHQLAHVRA